MKFIRENFLLSLYFLIRYTIRKTLDKKIYNLTGDIMRKKFKGVSVQIVRTKYGRTNVYYKSQIGKTLTWPSAIPAAYLYDIVSGIRYKNFVKNNKLEVSSVLKKYVIANFNELNDYASTRKFKQDVIDILKKERKM